MSVVVPDAIEPVIGWRGFDVHDGLLVSPQRKMPWRPGGKATAECGNTRWEQKWVQVVPEQRRQLELEAIESGCTAVLGQYVNYLMGDGTINEMPVYMPWGMLDYAPPITVYPEEGKEWVLWVDKRGHPSPDEQCNCGIHIAKKLTMALDYISRDAVFGRVQGWGKVVPASHGYRVEFAYPAELYVLEKSRHHLAVLRENYGVPIFLAEQCGEYSEPKQWSQQW